jgi:peptidyl-prolyl cis-trans isomerase SurA
VQGESIVATVNDDIITTYDLRQRLLLLIVEAGVQPTEQQLPQLEREALRRLVDERLQMQELRRVEKERNLVGKLISNDEQVAREVARIAQQSRITPAQLQQALAEAGVSMSTLRERLRAQSSWERWVGGRYGTRLKIGQEQIAATLKQINAAASKPSFLVSEIFIESARVGGPNEALAGAQQLAAQIQQGAPFGAVARQFSAAASAAQGGDAGWLQENELAAPLLPVLSEMRPGQVSVPVPVADGVYIVQLRDKRAGAGATVVNLKQAAVQLAPAASEADVRAAQTKLIALKRQITGCEGLEARAATVEGVIAGDLGEAELNELDTPFRNAAQALEPGQVSDPIRTQVGLHLVAVCAKRAGGAQAPTADQVENRLYGQQLALVSRRYMRDLRNSATIESR